MRFAPEAGARTTWLVLAAIAAALIWGWVAGTFLLAMAIAVLLFFRDPERVPAGSEEAVLSPADGRVVRVDDRPHPLEPRAHQRVSIFMSPLDVHVNRSPVDGRVVCRRYLPGRFGAAYKADASDANESNELVLRAAAGYPLVVVQIAGWLARRIVCDVRDGDPVERGKRFGLIMFGSRVDVYLPDEISVQVRPGQRVRAGETAIGEPTARTGNGDGPPASESTETA
ncbi:MAG: phosphatidylserine decarboxylase [Candidatus Dadabacteria bacterium]|nr:MAG: phosphatidylserine decarboxylase [Candidatus Dadabacteria bacterium]